MASIYTELIDYYILQYTDFTFQSVLTFF